MLQTAIVVGGTQVPDLNVPWLRERESDVLTTIKTRNETPYKELRKLLWWGRHDAASLFV
jgi:hypothetical protein